jgi:hypothetical protein
MPTEFVSKGGVSWLNQHHNSHQNLAIKIKVGERIKGKNNGRNHKF